MSRTESRLSPRPIRGAVVTVLAALLIPVATACAPALVQRGPGAAPPPPSPSVRLGTTSNRPARLLPPVAVEAEDRDELDRAGPSPVAGAPSAPEEDASVAPGAKSRTGAAGLGAAPSPVVVDRVEVDPRRRTDSVWGVRVSFHHRWTGLPDGTSGRVVVHFRTAEGRPLRATVDSPELRDRRGWVRLEAYGSGVGGGAQVADFFVPFYAMDLPPGPHRLALVFEAERTAGYQGREEHPMAMRAPPPTLEIVKPPTRSIDLLVSRIEVAPGQYDVAPFRPHKARPDLFWQLRFGSHPGGVVHRSRVHLDTYETEWDTATPTFQWSEGDRLSIDVFDADGVIDDLLASFGFTYEQLRLAAARGRPLSRGSVRRLDLEVMVR